MTSGQWTAIAIIGITVLFGIGVWYAQTRAYYAPVEMAELSLTSRDGTALTIRPDDLRGIDAESSPLRFRACFTLPENETAALLAEVAPHPDPVPLIAPAWFECYNATQLGADLEGGLAQGLTAEVEIARGIDRVVALYPDGRGFAWHQLNGTLE